MADFYLGTGTAEMAKKKLKGRRSQIDAEVEKAVNTGWPKPQPKNALRTTKGEKRKYK